jgi:uncharacterized protein with HEPN domain
MPPTLGDRLIHILDAIDTIEKGLAGKSFQDFSDDLLLRLAVERSYEIVSEASRHIPADMKDRETQINWRRMADLGNWLRHAYHRIDAAVLWDIAESDLTPLRLFVARIVRESKR